MSIIKNRTLSSETFPYRFKVDKAVPIHKGNLKTEVNNYRLISVVPLLSKISDRVVHSQVYKIIEKHYLFSKIQFDSEQKNRHIRQ